ncbi:(LSU ribosomal protein L11P)-lysine N-methyltransferase [Desulfosporosinus acidiphilus SJ4]|uniref:Ribosomal protein L11 methyltransferase n=1 Tax=Desulfosporosinus acidiphilus (strain DSM 22704 / JCM 16185 / SJ4) TaxID=646529 RepID=I4DAQ1_DESAJ|nr:50S ribosomal protein L11 methyltransferase [Desulfosporosinus acidiphilus]AFM42875.1 (LSU ribosomal protein L11P)-lysine N-methyltransferase [Desulfosporosinus acidiphilus SJ4]
MDWREVAVTISAEGEEIVADLFYQLGCPGVSVDDPEILRGYIESGTWDFHDFGEVEYTGTAVVKGYFPEDNELPGKLEKLDLGIRELLERFPEWVVQVKGISLKEEDWATAWKAYFKPVRIGKRFLIKPSWEQVNPSPEDIVLELDPGMAFGTGTHPTTTLCLRALETIVKPGQKVFDLGTGSGILAIAAAKLGAEVEAVDLDSVAVRVAQENVDLNQVSEKVRVLRGDLGTVLSGQAEIVIANIIADVIIMLLEDLKRILSPEGEFLASGIIEHRALDVEEGMKKAGLEILERVEDSGWILFRARWANHEPV